MTTREVHDCDTATAVIIFVRASRVAADRAEADLLASAVTWAAMHSVDSLEDALCHDLPGSEQPVAVAGDGAPLVAEFCVLELAVAMNMSSEAGGAYLGEAIELAHRLPKTYARVMTLDLPAWKARRIAKTTVWLSAEAAAYVDRHVAPVAHRIGVAQLDRLIHEAATRHDPAAAAERARQRADARRFDIDTRQISFDGHVLIDGVLDVADALDLEDAIARGARALADLHAGLPLDIRRAMAVGDLARRQLSLDLNTDDIDGPAPGRTKPRQVVLYVHLADAAVARVENTRSFVSVEQVKTWCQHPDSQVVIKPVIDLTGHEQVGAYEVPDRIRERQVLLQHTCVFPWCTKPARHTDLDHVEAAARGGPTADTNLAPLCRRHHRAKTFTRWRYDKTDPTTFVWRSPAGMTIRRDHTGTQITTEHPQP